MKTIKLKPRVTFDPMEYIPVPPTCSRCGGEKSTPQCWRTVVSEEGEPLAWACCACLTHDEQGIWKPKPKGDVKSNVEESCASETS